ncbi:MAG: aldehyde ferredoxin oxidoreductase C-terminal domain-containing protein, partial [Synergistaceae bacterium]|nr:aldehyde ferredoxin oxidoreductase C-terminal domain-containing protein [Synergistaceae bacterium]
ISLGCTLAWATESFLRGTLSLEETGGLPLAFGDGAAYLEMLGRMAKGQGEFYRDLEKGCAFCARKYGGDEWAIQYGGVEPGGYMTGENFALTCMMGVRHSHLDDTGYSIDQKLLNADQPLEEQVRAQVKEAQWRMVLNSLMICLFARGVYDEQIILEGLAALDLKWDNSGLQEMAEKSLLRKYEWKALCGFDHKSVKIPEKMYSVQTATGLMGRKSLQKRLRLYRKYAGL